MAKHFTLMCTCTFDDMKNARLLYFQLLKMNYLMCVYLSFWFNEFPKLKYLLLVKTIGNKPDPSKHLQTWNHDNPSVEINNHIFRC